MSAFALPKNGYKFTYYKVVANNQHRKRLDSDASKQQQLQQSDYVFHHIPKAQHNKTWDPRMLAESGPENVVGSSASSPPPKIVEEDQEADENLATTTVDLGSAPDQHHHHNTSPTPTTHNIMATSTTKGSNYPEPAVITPTTDGGLKAGGGPKMKMQKIKLTMPTQVHQLDGQHLLTVHGILKILQIILTFLTFVCSISSYGTTAPVRSEPRFTEAISFSACTIILFGLLGRISMPHLLEDNRTKEGLNFIGLVYHVLAAIMFFVCGCMMAAWSTAVRGFVHYLGAIITYSNKGLSAAAGFASVIRFPLAVLFAFLSCILFAIGAVMYFLDWSQRENKLNRTLKLPQRGGKTTDLNGSGGVNNKNNNSNSRSVQPQQVQPRESTTIEEGSISYTEPV